MKSLTQSDSANKQQSQDLNQVLCLTLKHALVLHKDDLMCRPLTLGVTKTTIPCEITQSRALLFAT